MNIVKDTIARIEERAKQTKKPCKLFATEERAEACAIENAKLLSDYFTRSDKQSHPARYVVIFIPSLGKWTCAFDMTELMQRSTSTGGYLGIMADKGLYTF